MRSFSSSGTEMPLSANASDIEPDVNDYHEVGSEKQSTEEQEKTTELPATGKVRRSVISRRNLYKTIEKKLDA